LIRIRGRLGFKRRFDHPNDRGPVPATLRLKEQRSREISG